MKYKMIDQILNYLALDLSTRILKASVFILISGLGIRFATGIVRKAAERKYSEPVVVDLVEDAGKFFMWFWVILATMSILGFSGIASSIGTASGFVALGVAFALKDVISDTVAGAYLAQDSDFSSGDKMIVDGTEGVLEDVGLRKTRIRLGNGDLRVINNSDAEKKWTKIE